MKTNKKDINKTRWIEWTKLWSNNSNNELEWTITDTNGKIEWVINDEKLQEYFNQFNEVFWKLDKLTKRINIENKEISELYNSKIDSDIILAHNRTKKEWKIIIERISLIMELVIITNNLVSDYGNDIMTKELKKKIWSYYNIIYDDFTFLEVNNYYNDNYELNEKFAKWVVLDNIYNIITKILSFKKENEAIIDRICVFLTSDDWRRYANFYEIIKKFPKNIEDKMLEYATKNVIEALEKVIDINDLRFKVRARDIDIIYRYNLKYWLPESFWDEIPEEYKKWLQEEVKPEEEVESEDKWVESKEDKSEEEVESEDKWAESKEDKSEKEKIEYKEEDILGYIKELIKTDDLSKKETIKQILEVMFFEDKNSFFKYLIKNFQDTKKFINEYFSEIDKENYYKFLDFLKEKNKNYYKDVLYYNIKNGRVKLTEEVLEEFIPLLYYYELDRYLIDKSGYWFIKEAWEKKELIKKVIKKLAKEGKMWYQQEISLDKENYKNELDRLENFLGEKIKVMKILYEKVKYKEPELESENKLDKKNDLSRKEFFGEMLRTVFFNDKNLFFNFLVGYFVNDGNLLFEYVSRHFHDTKEFMNKYLSEIDKENYYKFLDFLKEKDKKYYKDVLYYNIKNGRIKLTKEVLEEFIPLLYYYELDRYLIDKDYDWFIEEAWEKKELIKKVIYKLAKEGKMWYQKKMSLDEKYYIKELNRLFKWNNNSIKWLYIE